jgi:hypothetical protein
MPTRIEKLTQKQKDAMPAYRDMWIAKGLQTGETDWDTFDKYMPICYEKAGISYPKRVVRVMSPMVGAFAAAIAEGILRKRDNAIGDEVIGEVRNAVGNAVSNSVGVAVRGAVGVAVGGAVGDAVSGAVNGAVRGAVGVAVGGAVVDAVGDAVGGAVNGAVGGAVSGAVGVAVRGAVGVAVVDAVRGAVRGAVGGAVGDAVGDAVRNAVGVAVGDAVRGAVNGAVSVAVRNAVSGAVGDAVGNLIKAGVPISEHYWFGGQFWVGGWYWGVSFVNFFFDVCGLKFEKDIMERALAYRKVCESVNYIWPNRDFVMVCARPTKISRNVLGQLHCENGMAIQYPDGWGLYLLNGVRFDETLYKKVIDPSWPFSERMKIVDIDQRTQAINPKFCDIDAFIKEAKGELLDERTKYDIDANPGNYKLYKFPRGPIFTEDAYYCYFDCPSTGKKHLEGVEVAKTVAEAMAWAEDITVQDWENRIPLVHEN